MRCCLVSSCCFGCKPLKPGLYILAILNLLLNLGLALIPRLIISLVNQNGHLAWLSILIAADVLLAVGTKAGIRLLLLPWLIVNAINIFLLIPLAIFLAVLSCVVITKSDLPPMSENSTAPAPSGAAEWHVNLMMERMEESGTARVATCFFYVILIWYIYLWILVRSLFVVMGEAEHGNTTWIRRVRRVHHTIEEQDPVFTIETRVDHPAVLNKRNNHWFYGNQLNQQPPKMSKDQFQQMLNQHFSKKNGKELESSENRMELGSIDSKKEAGSTESRKDVESTGKRKDIENAEKRKEHESTNTEIGKEIGAGVLSRDEKIIN